jgi:hypothetical protein
MSSFELLFDRSQMVSYTVLTEGYGVYPEDPEQFDGKLFRKFSWSHLLEFTKQTTIASELYPGPLEHYQIACLNHVVDVITTGPPAHCGWLSAIACRDAVPLPKT